MPPPGARGNPGPFLPSPAQGAPPPPPASQQIARREVAAKAEPGQLVENIPRTMRSGVSERIEIRIARAQLHGLTEGLEGGGLAWRHDVTISKAMSVRLRAPEGGFFIETVSPETQWIDSQFADLGEDFASWRFMITPQQRGRSRLQIIVSARTVGSDGLAAETAFPDQIIEVRVRTNYGRLLARTFGWTVAALAGGAVAKFGEGALETVTKILSPFMG